MKTSLHRILSVLIVSTTLLLQGVSPRLAYSDDSFDRGEIQNALKDYYDHYAGRNTGDTQFLGTDRDRLTRVVARQLITLEANLFNDMVGHMIAVDYRQSPADREAIEKLVASMENEGRGTVFQTAKGAEEKAAMTVLADTVAVWSVACLAIGFGRSWAQADEMTGFERFAYVMKNTPEQMPKALKTKLAIAGLSLAVGASHAAYDYLYQTRFDPREALDAAAATAVIIGVDGAAGEAAAPVTMVVDRPYLVTIVDVPTGAILLLGHVVDPTDSGGP